MADSYNATTGLLLTVSNLDGVLHNDTDGDNDPLTAIIVTPPAHGTFTSNANGGFTYTSAGSFHGDDTFTYKANDTHADSATVTVTIHVNAIPVAGNDQYSTNEDTQLNIDSTNIGVLGNDTDADGTASPPPSCSSRRTAR